MIKKENIRDKYLDSAQSYQLLSEKEKKILSVLSIIRLLTFFGGIFLVILGFTSTMFSGIILLVIVTALFFYLLKSYSRHTYREEFFTNLSLINQNEAEAVSGNYSHFEAGNSFINPVHDFSNDIDLFGESSLFQFLNRTSTGYGREILAIWLSDPFSLKDQVEIRQKAINEIAFKDKWRHEFMALGMNRNLDRERISGLMAWMEEDIVIISSPVRKFLIWFLPIIAIISLLLTAIGLIHYTVFSSLFLVNLLYVFSGIKKTGKIHSGLTGKYNYLSSLKALLGSFKEEPFESQIFSDIKMRITSKDASAVESINKLSRLIQSFDSRMNFIVGFVLNGFLLWDYHCTYKLEKWKSEYRNHFPVWLEMLGQVDAYISLGNYTYNFPDFVFPEISNSNIVFSAKQLGHPLIGSSKRVCNDFNLEKPGNVCIISGANMAGKSTFLRTVAINYILAMTGAPVCAKEMTFIPVNLFSSMRTSDSLSSNESYFYVELKRLKILKTRIKNGEWIFFILDEILKGTNSEDKSLGSKLFLKRVTELGGTGLIATHDTSLGEMEYEFPGSITNKCFEVEIDGETIIFDYKLHTGITKKKNAVLLMKQMGILD